MIRLRALELLEKQGHTKYWLNKQLEMSYANLNNMLNNRTSSIRYDVMERLCQVLHCQPNDLFEFVEQPQED